jgi:hypothetical protein
LWPKPHKDPASPQIEVFYCSKVRSIASCVIGGAVFIACAEYFLRPGPITLLPSAFCLLFMGFGGFAVFCELRSLINPKAHALSTGPDGVSLATMGKPNVYAWTDIDKFIVSNELELEASERLSQLRGRHVTIVLKSRRKISIDDTYGWNNPDELAAYLYQRKRYFIKRGNRE